MSIRTVLTAHPGNTVITYLSAYPPPSFLVTSEDTKQTRRTKLQRQDELYANWLESAQDPTKSPRFPNGQLSGYLSGYGGSLYFIEDENGSFRVVLAHIFEDFSEQELDPLDGTTFQKAKKTGLELAKAFQESEALEAFRCYLSDSGFSDLHVRRLRYRQGGGV